MGNIDLVLAGNAVHHAENLLHLAGEHIDTVYLEHIITSSADDIKSRIL